MTDQTLPERVRALSEAATPGPWMLTGTPATWLVSGQEAVGGMPVPIMGPTPAAALLALAARLTDDPESGSA